MPRKYSPLNRTVFDLYVEKERLPWYFSTIALIASWLALGGYVICALVFTSRQNNVTTTRAVLTGVAVSFLIIGYTTIALAALFSKSLLFCFDSVLLPIMTASVMGLFITITNYVLHKDFSIPNKAYIYVPLAIASITTLTSLVLAGSASRQIQRINATDNRRRMSRSDMTYSGMYGSTTELNPMSMQIPEDEAQRQQLLRLLLKRENARTPSPERGSTYRIDLPHTLSGPAGGAYLSVPESESRGRSGSQPAIPKGNFFSNFVPSRSRSSTIDQFKDPRERRREEIERSNPGHSPPRPQRFDRWSMPAPSVSAQYQQPAWAPATRYA